MYSTPMTKAASLTFLNQIENDHVLGVSSSTDQTSESFQVYFIINIMHRNVYRYIIEISCCTFILVKKKLV